MHDAKRRLQIDITRLIERIAKLGDQVVVFQTDILNTSQFYNLHPNKVGSIFLDILEKRFINKTFLLPAFSNDLALKKKFDYKNYNINTGIVSKLASTRKYYRTFSPLHGFLARGELLNEIKNLIQKTTWGAGSVFEWLEKKNARWVALNLKWNRGCAFAHRSEEICKVPYRYYKVFSTKNLKKRDNKNNIIREKKFSIYKKLKIIFNEDNVFKYLKKYSIKIKINNGLFVNTALTKDITKVFCSRLHKDPFAMIKNKSELKKSLRFRL